MSDVNVDEVHGPEAPAGVNHMVFNVRDIEESEAFWTEILGYQRCGVNRRNPGFRFFHSPLSKSHHDIALVQLEDPGPEPEPWSMQATKWGPNHIAIAWPDRESWLRQLAWMQKQDVKFHIRLDHGMTHSVYISDPNGYGIEVLYELPREIWEEDINGALNYSVIYEGDPLVDNTDYHVFPPPAEVNA